MSRTSAQNPYNKAKVLAACKACLEDINNTREANKLQKFAGKKSFPIFGRILTPQEAFERAAPFERLQVAIQFGRQETIIEALISAANHCEGDVINLTNEEFCHIESYWKDSPNA